MSDIRKFPASKKGRRDYLGSAPEGSGNATDFLQLEYTDCEFLEPEVVDLTESEEVKKSDGTDGSGVMDQGSGSEMSQKTRHLKPKDVQPGTGDKDNFDEYLEKLLERFGTGEPIQVPPPPPLVRAPKRKQEGQQLELGNDKNKNYDPVEIYLDDDNGTETSVNSKDEKDGTSSNNKMQNWFIHKDGRRRWIGETPIHTLNPNDFPNDPDMQQRIRKQQVLQNRKMDIKRHIMETMAETRELRKWNSDLRDIILELANCGCERGDEVELSELLSRQIPETPLLNQRYYGELLQPPPPSSPMPMPSTSVSDLGGGKGSRKRPLASAAKNSAVVRIPPPQKIWNTGMIRVEDKTLALASTPTFQPRFINTGNCGPPPQKIWKAGIGAANHSPAGSTLAFRPIAINTGTGNRLPGSSVVAYQSHFRMTGEQMPRVQNIVGSIPRGGYQNYYRMAGPFRFILPNSLNPATTTTAMVNYQTPATAPPVSQMFFGMNDTNRNNNNQK